MKIRLNKVAKVSKESTDSLEIVLRRLFPKEEEYARGTGKTYENRHNQIPYDNRIIILKNSVAKAKFSAFSTNGCFDVSLEIDNLPTEVYSILLEQTKQSSPEMYNALKLKYCKTA